MNQFSEFFNNDYLEAVKNESPEAQLIFFSKLQKFVRSDEVVNITYCQARLIAQVIRHIRFSLIGDQKGGDVNIKSTAVFLRARKCGLADIKYFSDIAYPPSELCKSYGRCNSPGRSVLYAATDYQTIFSEVEAIDGDIIICARINTGYTLSFMALGNLDYAKRYRRTYVNGLNLEEFKPIMDILNSETEKALVVKIADAFIASEFSRPIDSSSKSDYIITSALAETLLDDRY